MTGLVINLVKFDDILRLIYAFKGNQSLNIKLLFLVCIEKITEDKLMFFKSLPFKEFLAQTNLQTVRLDFYISQM